MKKWFKAFTTVYLVGLLLYLALRSVVGDQWWWTAMLNNFVPFYFLPAFVLLPLALLLRDHLTALRLLPVIVIALLWFGPYFMPKAIAQQSTGTPIKVLTFNLWAHNRQLYTDTAEWVRAQGADIVFLQEAFPPRDPDKGLLDLIDLYPYQAVQSIDPDDWARGFMSRYPILSVESLPTMAAQRITLDVNGETIAVYNIHNPIPMRDSRHIKFPISSHYLDYVFRYDDADRNRHIEAFLTRIQSETLPYIVAGDFNMSDNTQMYPRLAAVMNDTFREVGMGFGTSWPAINPVMPPLVRIDYIWHSDQFRALSAQQGPDIGSDHLPLYATLEF